MNLYLVLTISLLPIGLNDSAVFSFQLSGVLRMPSNVLPTFDQYLKVIFLPRLNVCVCVCVMYTHTDPCTSDVSGYWMKN